MSSSTTQAVADNGVYMGFWTNWSRGAILGATLTLNHSDGGLLTAFLALFVTFTGTCFWRIICFVLHFVLSSQQPRDGLYHQQQAILRNIATGSGGLYRLLTAAWAWRGTAARVYVRILPLLVATVLIVSGFAVASVFSSKISTLTGDEVLLLGDNCFLTYNTSDIDANDYLQYYNPYTITVTTTAYTHAQQCYADKGASKDCSTMIKKSLPMKIDHDAGCPFYGGICLSNTSNIMIDTGEMSSHDDFGINAPPQDRFSYRLISHCAPIKTEGYHSFNISSEKALRGTHRYYYGAETMVFPQYSLMSMYNLDLSLFVPLPFQLIPELTRKNAYTTLLFLGGDNLAFMKPIDDLWYSAHIPHNRTGKIDDDTTTVTMYSKDEFMTALACFTQQQFCNPNLPTESGCSAVSNIGNGLAEISNDIWKTENQKASVGFIFNDTGFFDMPRVPRALGASSLLSRASSSGGLGAPLPNNQWQLEVQSWFNTTLAILQRKIVEKATGSRNEFIDKYAKVRSTDYTSFSVLGLALTLGIGSLIIVISYAIEPLTTFIQKRRNTHSYQRFEWTINETLQLQRLAHEEIGFGTWHNTDGDVPVTNPDEKLALVDLDDPEHPALAAHTCDPGDKATSTPPALSNGLEVPSQIPYRVAPISE
ncbi:hypothetical protein SLS58_009049 [Diplodia intermedia]|uniref:Uncharacterized protein n=1 Tax=Diplodia intermedia TaxID=856260 RepID=A0ABR3TF40_9PEZI